MNIHVITYRGNEHIEGESFNSLPEALIFAEEARGLATAFTIHAKNGRSMFGKYLKGKGKLSIHEA